METTTAKLELSYERQYRKERTEKQKEAGHPGTKVFVYTVKGAEPQVNDYLETKKAFIKSIKDDKGVVRFYSIRDLGNTCSAIKTGKGEWVADTSKADRLKSLTEQYGYEIAKDILAGNIQMGE